MKRLRSRIRRFHWLGMLVVSGSAFAALWTAAESLSAFHVVSLPNNGVRSYTALLLVALAFGLISEAIRTRFREITICQFGKTLPYLPLYVAIRRGYFAQEGLRVRLVDGMGDEPTWRKVASGDADFGVSDPIGMIRDPVTAGVVVATVVGRVAAWGVSKKQLEPIRSMDRFAALKTSVYRSPSTQHALLQKAVLDNGGKLDDCVFEHGPGSEMSPLQNDAVDVVWLPEPAATMAERAGASYVFSGPRALGEFLCTGCYCSKKYAVDNPEIVQAVVNAFDSAIQMIHRDHLAALDVVHQEFSHLPTTKVELATMRMIDEEVFPQNVAVDEDAWQSAVCVWFPGNWQNYLFNDYVDNHFAATSCNRRRR